MKPSSDKLIVRALRTQQGAKVDVYSFFLRGSDVTRVADISRIARDASDRVRGFQRKEIKTHVNSIVSFLNSGPVLFPNSIILALSPESKFKQSRGPAPSGLVQVAESGTLTIPIRGNGKKVAWIVDGQQRALALARAKNADLPVPVVGFVSADLETHREQFVLVNKAKPLPTRLINELLPEISALLPHDLAAKKLPSELCGLLNRDRKSPFFHLIRRESDTVEKSGIVVDTSIVEAIRRNLKPPMGALSQYQRQSEADADAMYKCLLTYWSAVKRAFPEAWGKTPEKSRLMHSAGIRVMGALMDQIMLRADSTNNPAAEVAASLARLAPHCSWVGGKWEQLGWAWNEVQNTAQHIRRLTDHLMRLDRELARPLR